MPHHAVEAGNQLKCEFSEVWGFFVSDGDLCSGDVWLCWDLMVKLQETNITKNVCVYCVERERDDVGKMFILNVSLLCRQTLTGASSISI